VAFYCEEEDSHQHALLSSVCARKANSRTHPSKNLGAMMMAPLKRIAAASKHLHFYF
jgi:hypothetical protein